MGVLLKNEIIFLSKDQNIRLLGDSFNEKNVESCSYDLRVGSVFKDKSITSLEFNEAGKPLIVEIKPSEIVTILTLEEVKLPNNIIATVFPINGLSSKGFLILNPGHIDPGYQGPISICAINMSTETVYLQIGETKIFTILFDKLDADAEEYKKNKLQARKLTEQDFHVNKASKLSSSFFDLIKVNEYKEHLEKVLIEIILNRILKVLGVIALIIGLVFSGIKIYETVVTWNERKVIKENKGLNDSIQKQRIIIDSLIQSQGLNKKDTNQ